MSASQPAQPVSPDSSASAAAARVRLLALDVDGVLTDGSINLDHAGRETKRYHAADGVALRTWTRLGLTLAVVTGRTSHSLLHRLAELGVGHVIQGSRDKRAAIAQLRERTGIAPEAMAFLGDDWPDLPALRAVGYPMAVANAAPEVKRLARYVTPRCGGQGAVRDAAEHLWRAQDLFARAVALYDPDYAQASAQR